jgi:uncharacterized protein YbaA (DUF1428 family)
LFLSAAEACAVFTNLGLVAFWQCFNGDVNFGKLAGMDDLLKA